MPNLLGETTFSGAVALPSVNVNGDGAFDQLKSGYWTPTLSVNTNVAASSSPTGQYIRIGDEVCFSIAVNIDPTAGAPTLTVIEFTLPIASNFTDSTKAVGTATFAGGTHYDTGYVQSVAANDTIGVQFYATSTANVTLRLHGIYIVL